jgi:alkylhydroperoxidase family enzyme
MPWKTWIDIEPADTSNKIVRQLYDRTRNRLTGQPPDTVRLTSLTPDVAGLLFDLQSAIWASARGLSIKEKEIAALVVASRNGCMH